MNILRILALTFLSSLICASSFAATITIVDISADSTVAAFNNWKDIVVNAINGDIEGSASASIINIKADSLGELDMGDNINGRIRDNELLGVGLDTITNSAAVRITGLQPATATGLTSNISAGEAYVNGFRVSKSATANTYTANRDTYVDLNQTGSFTFTTVTNDAAEPVVAANSIRLAKVVTDGSDITTVVDESNTLIPGLVIPSNYRSGMGVSRDVATPLTKVSVFPGTIEVDNTIITKTSTTTIDVDVAGDWASGTEDVTSSGYVYVGIDSSGNIKFDDTAPSHQNFGVSITVGKLKWATFTGSTVFRVLGWLFRDGSGQTQVYAWGNLKENDQSNSISRATSTLSPQNVTSTSYTDVTNSEVRFFTSGGPVMVQFNADVKYSASTAEVTYVLDIDGTNVDSSTRDWHEEATGFEDYSVYTQSQSYLGVGTHTIKAQVQVSANDTDIYTTDIVVTEF